MTRLARVEAELKEILGSDEFAEAKALLKHVGNLRFHVEHERYLEKYGATDRPTSGGL